MSIRTIIGVIGALIVGVIIVVFFRDVLIKQAFAPTKSQLEVGVGREGVAKAGNWDKERHKRNYESNWQYLLSD